MGLRSFIGALEDQRQVVHVSRRVDWRYEIGRMSRGLGVPALFTDILGYPGLSLFTNGLSSDSAVLLSLGRSSEEGSFSAVVRAIREAGPLVEPVLCDEPAMHMPERRGAEVDLTVLPVPWWHESDAGRYVGTWHVNISRHPATGAPNAGVYRMKILGRRHTTVSVSPKSHLALHMKEAERRGEELPLATAIGVPEHAVIAAAAALPRDVDEMAFAGALVRRPLAVRRCVLSRLRVPAEAEVVMEGALLPNIRAVDGPYMDYAGLTNVNPSAYVYEVRRLAVRTGLIFRGTAVGMPGAEDHRLFSMLAAAGLVDFHGSRVRRIVQNFCLRHRRYRLLQSSGRLSQTLRSLRKRTAKRPLPNSPSRVPVAGVEHRPEGVDGD